VFVIPSQIAKDLVELTQTNRKGVEALYEAETDLAQAEVIWISVSPKSFSVLRGVWLNGRPQRSLRVLTYGLTVIC
jgi:phosphatidate phosphatase APP1